VLTGQADPLTWVVRILGIGATVAVTLLVTRVARQALAAPALAEPDQPAGPPPPPPPSL